MNTIRFRLSLIVALLAMAGATYLMAQQPTPPTQGQRGPGGQMQGRQGAGRGGPRPRISPHETIYSRNDNNRVLIVYGRPYSKNPTSDEIRKIWGGLIPWGERWRLGSDEATLFITKQTLDMEGLTIPPGAYTLYMMPMENGASKLIVNKEIGQWGIGDPYDEKNELGRVDLKKDAVDPRVDEFTMAISANPGGGSLLKMTWENTQFSVPFTVKK